MIHELDSHQRVAAWKRDAIIEVFPSDKLPNVLPLIERIGKPVTVSVLPDYPWEKMQSTLLAFASLAPSVEAHVAVRSQKSKGDFLDVIDWLVKKDFNVFLIAGDGPQIGPYPGVPEALADVHDNKVALPPASYAAYPHEKRKRGHGIIPNETLNRALSYKQEVDTDASAVMQLNWDPKVIADWITRERDRGITLPFYINIFPPLSYKLITAYLRRIGLVNAKHIIATFPDPFRFVIEFAKGYSPDRLLLDLARLQADVAGIVVTSTNRFDVVQKWLDSPVAPKGIYT